MTEELTIFPRTFDFLSWLLPIAQNFPKNQRFVITSRLQNSALNFQELIIEANAQRGEIRLAKLRLADAELLKIRLYLRLSEKWQWISPGQYRHASSMVAEIGRLLGGWIKSSSAPIPRASSEPRGVPEGLAQ